MKRLSNDDEAFGDLDGWWVEDQDAIPIPRNYTFIAPDWEEDLEE